MKKADVGLKQVQLELFEKLMYDQVNLYKTVYPGMPLIYKDVEFLKELSPTLGHVTKGKHIHWCGFFADHSDATRERPESWGQRSVEKATYNLIVPLTGQNKSTVFKTYIYDPKSKKSDGGNGTEMYEFFDTMECEMLQIQAFNQIILHDNDIGFNFTHRADHDNVTNGYHYYFQVRMSEVFGQKIPVPARLDI